MRIFSRERIVLLEDNASWFFTLILRANRLDDHVGDRCSGNARHLPIGLWLSGSLRHRLGVAAEDYGGLISRVLLLELLSALLHVLVRVFVIEQDFVAAWIQEVQGCHVWVHFELASCLQHELIVVVGLDHSLGIILLDRKKHVCSLFVYA